AGRCARAPRCRSPCATSRRSRAHRVACQSRFTPLAARRAAAMPKLKLIPDRRGPARVWRGSFRGARPFPFFGPPPAVSGQKRAPLLDEGARGFVLVLAPLFLCIFRRVAGGTLP